MGCLVYTGFCPLQTTTMQTNLPFRPLMALVFLGMLAFRAHTQTTWLLEGNSDAANAKMGTTNTAPLRFFTNNAERMRIDSEGNAGIGVPNTTIGSIKSRLVVNAPASVTPFRIMINNSTRLLVGTNSGLSIGTASSAPANGLYVAGNVGIGTGSPAARLEVQRNDGLGALARFANTATAADRSALVELQSAGDLPAPWRFGVGGTGNSLGLTAGQFYVERVSGGVRLLVAPNGNVGIGTTNPLYRLSVNGTIQAKEVRVETGWADHVFDSSYRLRPLSEVQAYIAQYQHLPDMPTAKKIQEEGLELAAVNTLMMQKIEELTLYLLEQEHKIRRLEEKVHQLEQKKRR